jgi:hypothetical protein
MGDFPESGDNFTTRGPWQILEGQAWVDWQRAALAAGAAAARAGGNCLAAARMRAAEERLWRLPVSAPTLGPVPEQAPD